MNRIVILFLALIICNNLRSQDVTATNWYFGYNAGVTFNTGIPIANTLGQIYDGEGVATIGDTEGNLLFYTDGMTVYNRNHEIMPNGEGLLGQLTSSQCVIIPYPGSDSLFYIFTTDAIENQLEEGLRYSIVDMSLDGGFGDINATKNILLETPVTEKIVSVLNANNISIWIIAHRWNSDEFVAYDVTSTGINPIPVVSSIGTLHTGGSSTTPAYNGYTNAGATMTASVDGTKIGLAIYRMNKFEIFDFNKGTGQLSNCISSPAVYYEAYGVEFSPDGSKFYGTTIAPNRIYQFDMLQPNPLNASILITSPVEDPRSLQLGPDGKIYVSILNSTYLSVIHRPNEAGLLCQYQGPGVYLQGSICRSSLPPLFYFKGFEFITGSQVNMGLCDGDSVLIDGVYITEPGLYYETLNSSLGWDSILNITLTTTFPSFSSINELCCEANYTSPSGNYTWTSSGVYHDTITNISGCDSIMTINLSFGIDNGYSIEETACDFYVSPGGNHTWTESGIYEEVFTNTTGCDSVITINLTINNSNSTVLHVNTCEPYISPTGLYTWSETGTYQETISNIYGCDSTVTVHLYMHGSSINISEFVCDGMLSPSGDHYWTNTGTYIDTIPDSWGCDSIITINLTVSNNTTSEIFPQACDNYVSPAGFNLFSSGTYYETITNSTGCDSVITINLELNNSSTTTINETACNSYTSPSGNHTWTVSGSYFDAIETVHGCDSNIYINLTVNYVNASVSQYGSTLVANAAGAVYIWVDCDNSYMPVSGENSQVFTPEISGNYAVIVNQNSCTEISNCFYVNGVGNEEFTSNNQIDIFPNPTNGLIYVFGRDIQKIELFNSLGENIGIQSINRNTDKIAINLENYSKGIYLVKVWKDEKPESFRIVLE
jgi:hypothetical protein